VGKLIKALFSLVAIVVGGTVVIVVVAGVAGLIFYRSSPKIEVTNNCSDPIMIPEQYRVVSAIPEYIPTGSAVTVPAISGAGEYSLYEDGEGVYIGFPRSIPGVGESVRIGSVGMDTDATFDGAPVSIPMAWDLESERYPLVLCP
jgi:hypothetical protein